MFALATNRGCQYLLPIFVAFCRNVIFTKMAIRRPPNGHVVKSETDRMDKAPRRPTAPEQATRRHWGSAEPPRGTGRRSGAFQIPGLQPSAVTPTERRQGFKVRAPSASRLPGIAERCRLKPDRLSSNCGTSCPREDGGTRAPSRLPQLAFPAGGPAAGPDRTGSGTGGGKEGGPAAISTAPGEAADQAAPRTAAAPARAGVLARYKSVRRKARPLFRWRLAAVPG